MYYVLKVVKCGFICPFNVLTGVLSEMLALLLYKEVINKEILCYDLNVTYCINVLKCSLTRVILIVLVNNHKDISKTKKI